MSATASAMSASRVLAFSLPGNHHTIILHPYNRMSVDISSGSIVDGYIHLLPGTTYNLTSNLVVDGTTFLGFAEGESLSVSEGGDYKR